MQPENVVLPGGLEMQMVYLEGGSFAMGSPRTEVGHENDEVSHEVTLSGFWISEHEVTQAHWEAIMGNAPSDCERGCGAAFPVNHVTWIDAVRFLNTLSSELTFSSCYEERAEGWNLITDCNGFRLPNEAEWEYAAWAGGTTAYSFGDDPSELCRYGNLDAQSLCRDGHVELAPVGSFEPNLWGLYDMHGNVWEWVGDEYGTYPTKRTRAPTKTSDTRVLRGVRFGADPCICAPQIDTRSHPRAGMCTSAFDVREVVPSLEDDGTQRTEAKRSGGAAVRVGSR